jgi:hypothetical protein
MNAQKITPCAVGGSPEGAGVAHKQALEYVAHDPPGFRFARADPPASRQGGTKPTLEVRT